MNAEFLPECHNHEMTCPGVLIDFTVIDCDECIPHEKLQVDVQWKAKDGLSLRDKMGNLKRLMQYGIKSLHPQDENPLQPSFKMGW